MDASLGHQDQIGEAFASVLQARRAEFNARFAEARRSYPGLDANAFTAFLRSEADLLVRAVHVTNPERVFEVAAVAYDVGLELAGHQLAWARARHQAIEQAWRKILCPAARLVAVRPGRLVSSVCNALHNLQATPGARPEQWVSEMERLGPQCGDPDTFLRLGQVLAWKAGMAHLRQSAISIADELPERITLSLIGAPAGARWPSIREQLLADPWFDPGRAEPSVLTGAPLPIMARIGAFRGFGGLFHQPPHVVALHQDFLVRSGGDCWYLTADCFGATFHRANLADFDAAARQTVLPDGLKLKGSVVLWNNRRVEIADSGAVSSTAATKATLALTTEMSHTVILVALNRPS